MAATQTATDIGFLTTFSKKTGPSTYVPLAEVTELAPPELSRDAPDFTHFGSPAFTREYKPGLTDPGECTLSYALVPGLTDDLVITTHLAARTVDGWRITFPNGATLDFNGFATKHGRATPMDEKMVGSVTFKVSGPATLTPAV
ncbi:phage tail tube protein [Sphingomonas sp. MMS24-J13]|uniref:phage tail tube protein n=1 Tax=Sphingomonas sp. MMS24-J13 TaxID=3238686 RepID=UPI00384ABB8C